MEIPTHDPYTGELNPYYEELTGKKNPLDSYHSNKDSRDKITNHFNENEYVFEMNYDKTKFNKSIWVG